jgi:hypothetical protein
MWLGFWLLTAGTGSNLKGGLVNRGGSDEGSGDSGGTQVAARVRF